MIDAFYTPSHLAELMASHVQNREPKLIADFAAGDGELLRVAHTHWPRAGVIAADIDRGSIRHIKRRNPAWSTGCCDFLHERSRSRCGPLRDQIGAISLVLLNPPFSYRGAKSCSVSVDKNRFSCTKALAFVATSIQYLSENGELLAILPTGTMFSEKDVSMWSFLRNRFDVRTIAEQERHAFSGCTARTIIVHLARLGKGQKTSRQKGPLGSTEVNNSQNLYMMKLVRGVVQMHTVNGTRSPKALPLIHSTDLSGSLVREPQRRTNQTRRILTGPAVLLPRVGEPRRDKVVLYLSRNPVVLSDCVIGLMCTSQKKAREVQTLLKRNWRIVKGAYGGTCAKYATLASLRQALTRLDMQFTTTSGN
jgi:tRNA1(Val) A37 N6-methylase TrmN6